ncbi:hypothetical protein MMC07_006490 [Pseudocyphellaria aurata]|nr:hypothetical protein [Pseudocyphellaria aurata]
MSHQQANSFSSQCSGSPVLSTAANTSIPGVDASSSQVNDIDTRSKYTKAAWNAIAARLESKLRPWILRYGKLTEDQMVKLVRDATATGDIDLDNLWFKKCIIKMRTNQSTWKNRTLGAIGMNSYVKRMLDADDGGMLKDTVDPKVLFQHFALLPLNDMETAFFAGLAVKTKLHLDRPRDEGFDRQALLDYYDQFPSVPQFSSIKPRHFQLKTLNPRQRSRATKVALRPGTMAFGTLNEEMEVEDKSGSDDDDLEEYQDPQGNGGQGDEEHSKLLPKMYQSCREKAVRVFRNLTPGRIWRVRTREST